MAFTSYIILYHFRWYFPHRLQLSNMYAILPIQLFKPRQKKFALIGLKRLLFEPFFSLRRYTNSLCYNLFIQHYLQILKPNHFIIIVFNKCPSYLFIMTLQSFVERKPPSITHHLHIPREFLNPLHVIRFYSAQKSSRFLVPSHPS